MTPLPGDLPARGADEPIRGPSPLTLPEELGPVESQRAGKPHVNESAADTTYADESVARVDHGALSSSVQPYGLAHDDLAGSRDHASDEDEEGAKAVSSANDPKTSVEVGSGPDKKKKKKSKKTKGQKKRGTGFEEYYADTPTTPAEALDERGVYDISNPFEQRIEECIQRYRHRRKLQPDRALVFDKYLWMGGIDSSPRQFTGTDAQELKDCTTDEIRMLRARDFIPIGSGASNRFYNPAKPEDWAVDFTGVVKGFLSQTVFDLYGWDHEAIKAAAETIKNFLNYVLLHDVCPEYADDVHTARGVCDTAAQQHWNIHNLVGKIPDSFNTAACALFRDGNIKKLGIEKGEENPEIADGNGAGQPLTAYHQYKIFRLIIMDTVEDSAIRQLVEEHVRFDYIATMKVETYEVISVRRPGSRHKKLFQEGVKQLGLAGTVNVCGALLLRPTIIDHAYADMPRSDEVDFSNYPPETFHLEDGLLAKFERGMKLKLCVCELDIGLRFIEEVLDFRCSFDTLLPQSLMDRWRDPAPNERPPPSLNDDEVEEERRSNTGEVDD